MNPSKWHACAAFVASGLEHASATAPARAPAPARDAKERTLTRALRVFDVDCVAFFRALRVFMSAGAAELTKRLEFPRKQTASVDTAETAKASGGIDGDARHAGLDALEAALSVPELRTSFAFTRVAAQKYKLFADVHLDATNFAGGADVARFGWRLFLAAKHSVLPKFPDLFSLYHALVAAEAFLLVNAPRGALRTDVANMVSVAAGTSSADPETGRRTVDVLAGLAASSKTKLPTLRAALEDLEREVVVGSLKREPETSKSADSPFAETGPRAFKGVFGDGGAAGAAAAAAEAADAYASASVASGLAWHLRLDEGLYFALGAEEEAQAKRVLGDLGAGAGAGAGVAATPRPGGQAGVPSTPWRGAGTMRFVLGASPARLGSKAAYSPYPASRLGGAAGERAGGAGGAGAPAPFTPVSEAMASASWLHGIVSASAPGGAASLPPAARLARFLGEESAARLVETVHGLAGKTSAALREDAFLVTINGVAALAGAGHNVSLDNLVRRRQEEAVRVFAYFAEGVFEGEHRRAQLGQGGAPGSREAAPRAGNPGENEAPGGVADVATLAAAPGADGSAAGHARVVVPDPDEASRANFRALAGSSRFVRAVLACAMEVVVASYKTATLKFPAVPRLLGLDAFDVVGIIEPFVRADPTMPREVKKHFNAIEERVMETMAWRRGSSLFGYMRAAEAGAPPLGARPAAAALAAVSKPGPSGERGARGAGASPRRAPSFSSVAGVAAAAAEGASDTAMEPEPPVAGASRGGGSFDEDDVTPPRRKAKTDAEATTMAFSTPLRSSTTPSRPARLPSGAAASLSAAGGGGGEPLPSRFVREPPAGSPGDATARNSLRVFFAKVMRTSARRLADLCERLYLPQELTKAAYDLVSRVVYEHTKLLYNRHLDQILLCAVYGVCKVNGARGSALEDRQVTFRDIIACYHKQPQCREETFWTVSLEQSDPELEVTRRGDVIQFYNQVFVPEVKTRLLELKTSSASSGSGASTGNVETADPQTTSAVSHPQLLRSPRRALPGNSQAPRSVYVSPMRSSAAAAAQNLHMTPRSKSLFAFVGESTHAYRSPGRDLQFINRRINDAANADKAETEKAISAHTVAGVAAAAAPPAARKSSARALGFGEARGAPRGGGEEDARPPKVPRR
jgi:retinoblastoma-like protein 1